MKTNLYFVAFLLLVSLSFISCGGGAIPTVMFKESQLSETQQSTQSKGNVEISLTSLNPSSTYDYPELFSFVAENITGNYSTYTVNSMFPKDYQKTNWLYTFGPGNNNLVVYQVKLKNSTDHILRMKDARVYLIIDNQDPIAAIIALGNPTLVSVLQGKEQVQRPKSFVDGDGSLIHWVTKEEEDFERTREKGLISVSYPIGLCSQVIYQNMRNYKLVNDVAREILPGTSFEGILVFPAYISDFNIAKISFYDITTKTDAAGNPIEKTAFEFPIKSIDQQMWFDKEHEKRWKVGTPNSKVN